MGHVPSEVHVEMKEDGEINDDTLVILLLLPGSHSSGKPYVQNVTLLVNRLLVSHQIYLQK